MYVNPNTTDMQVLTPLSIATFGGHERAVELLQQRVDANPSGRGDCGGSGTPPPTDTRKAHEEVMKQLTSAERCQPQHSPETRANATLRSHLRGDEAVKVLLKQWDVDRSLPDDYGVTPLCTAVFHGHVGIVRVLLERMDDSPDTEELPGERYALELRSMDIISLWNYPRT